jgi:hypothetical protein
VDAAERLIVDHDARPAVIARLAGLRTALEDAESDRRRVAAALEGLHPDRVLRELRDALRDRSTGVTGGPDADDLVATLRGRYEAVQALQDRDEALGARVDATVAELERLSARTLEASVTRASHGDLTTDLQRLSDDLAAMQVARDELRGL